MIHPSRVVRLALGRLRGRRVFVANTLAAFGLVSGLVQFVGQVFAVDFPSPGLIALVTFGMCVMWGLFRALPSTCVSREFDHPRVTVTVRGGDLFEQSGHLVIGFSDTFDTDVSNNEIVSRKSIQGQLLEHMYEGDRVRLDVDLAAALRGFDVRCKERRECKPRGKLDRYAVGTVAVLSVSGRKVFCLAYSHMGNDLVARSTVEQLWQSLGRLWEAVHKVGQLEPVAIPLVGAGLARVDSLTHESLLKMVLLSFVAHAREAVLCRDLTVVICPRDLERIDMLEVEAFLKAL